jgi:D-amino peptidase
MMNLYVSCDMEGTAGVCSWVQCDPENDSEYPRYRRFMMQEVRAAIEGARRAGAGSVAVNDSHSSMRNVLWEELPADVRVISGSPKPHSMTEGMAPQFDGAFFTGYHARGGEENGVLAHTYTSDSIYNVRINGIACSEALLNAAMAGYHGIPVLLVTGDSTTVRHVREHMPWVVGASVKDAIGYYAANSMTPAAAQALIREKAAEAVRGAGAAQLFRFESPVTMEMEMTRVEQADFVELMPGFTRISGRTLRFTHVQYPAVFEAFVAAFRLAGAASARA